MEACDRHLPRKVLKPDDPPTLEHLLAGSAVIGKSDTWWHLVRMVHASHCWVRLILFQSTTYLPFDSRFEKRTWSNGP